MGSGPAGGVNGASAVAGAAGVTASTRRVVRVTQRVYPAKYEDLVIDRIGGSPDNRSRVVMRAVGAWRQVG